MKFASMFRMVAMSIALCAMLAAGCGKVRDAAARAKKSNDLKRLGIMYNNYCQTNGGKAPANADDLMKMTAGDPVDSQAVQAVKAGQYVLLWGSTLTEMGKAAGVSVTVLGYERDAPASGGVVLMGDALTRNMTAAEFQAAPKAPGK